MKITKSRLKKIIKEEINTRLRLEQIIREELEAVSLPQIAQEVLDSYLETFTKGAPNQVTKKSSYWEWSIPVEQAEAAGMDTSKYVTPTRDLDQWFQNWRFDTASGAYINQLDPTIQYSQRVQGPGTSSGLVIFTVTKKGKGAQMTETSPTFGLRNGEMVRHKDEPDLGVGRVVSKGSKRDNFVLVLWSDRTQRRHIPSELVKEE